MVVDYWDHSSIGVRCMVRSNVEMKYIAIIVLIAAITAGCASAGPQMVQWNPPPAHVDGSPVIEEDILYRVWHEGLGTVLYEGITNTTALIVYGGKYHITVTAYYADYEGSESDHSNAVEVKIHGKLKVPPDLRKVEE